MFYKVTVYQIVDFYLIATSADPVLSFLCGDKSELHPLRHSGPICPSYDCTFIGLLNTFLLTIFSTLTTTRVP